MPLRNTPHGYGAVAKVLHWGIVVLIIAQYVLAEAAHGILYLLLLVLPFSGWMMSTAAGYPTAFFGLFEFPMLVGENHDLHEALEEVHETLFNAVVVVAVLHALAAVFHHVWMKDDTLRRMLPFVRTQPPG